MKKETMLKLSYVCAIGCAIGATLNAFLMVVLKELDGVGNFAINAYWFGLGFAFNFLNIYLLTRKDNK